MSQEAKGRIFIGDVTNGACPTGTFELVTCIEVAEHIEPEKTDAFLDALAAKTSEYLYFTANATDTANQHHINMHPHDWWVEQLSKRGLVLDAYKTGIMREEARSEVARWIADDSLVFAKGEANG